MYIIYTELSSPSLIDTSIGASSVCSLAIMYAIQASKVLPIDEVQKLLNEVIRTAQRGKTASYVRRVRGLETCLRITLQAATLPVVFNGCRATGITIANLNRYVRTLTLSVLRRYSIVDHSLTHSHYKNFINKKPHLS